MATRDKSVARTQPEDTSSEGEHREPLDTLPDDSLALSHASTIPTGNEEKSRVRLKTHALLAQSMNWYGNQDTIPIRDLQAERLAQIKREEAEQFQIEQDARIQLFRRRMLDTLDKSFLNPAIQHIEAQTRGYSPQKAMQKTVDYLEQLFDLQYCTSMPTNKVKDLQTVVMNGDWKTVTGIRKTRSILEQLLF